MLGLLTDLKDLGLHNQGVIIGSFLKVDHDSSVELSYSVHRVYERYEFGSNCMCICTSLDGID